MSGELTPTPGSGGRNGPTVWPSPTPARPTVSATPAPETATATPAMPTETGTATSDGQYRWGQTVTPTAGQQRVGQPATAVPESTLPVSSSTPDMRPTPAPTLQQGGQAATPQVQRTPQDGGNPAAQPPKGNPGSGGNGGKGGGSKGKP